VLNRARCCGGDDDQIVWISSSGHVIICSVEWRRGGKLQSRLSKRIHACHALHGRCSFRPKDHREPSKCFANISLALKNRLQFGYFLWVSGLHCSSACAELERRDRHLKPVPSRHEYKCSRKKHVLSKTAHLTLSIKKLATSATSGSCGEAMLLPLLSLQWATCTMLYSLRCTVCARCASTRVCCSLGNAPPFVSSRRSSGDSAASAASDDLVGGLGPMMWTVPQRVLWSPRCA